MRELKFRVWNNRYNEFVRPDYGLIGFCYPLDGRIAALTTSGEPMEGCIIEQYTGLKDKSGKEIYEGDIIREKWFDEDVRLGENRVGKVEYFTDGFVCWFVGGRLMQLGMLVGSHIEVIGNIHETPELLGGKE